MREGEWWKSWLTKIDGLYSNGYGLNRRAMYKFFVITVCKDPSLIGNKVFCGCQGLENWLKSDYLQWYQKEETGERRVKLYFFETGYHNFYFNEQFCSRHIKFYVSLSNVGILFLNPRAKWEIRLCLSIFPEEILTFLFTRRGSKALNEGLEIGKTITSCASFRLKEASHCLTGVLLSRCSLGKCFGVGDGTSVSQGILLVSSSLMRG